MQNAWRRNQEALKIQMWMILMTFWVYLQGLLSWLFFHDFSLRTAPHYRAPEAKGKQLAVFQVLDHSRDRFLACGSNSTSKIHEAQEFFEHLCHYWKVPFWQILPHGGHIDWTLLAEAAEEQRCVRGHDAILHVFASVLKGCGHSNKTCSQHIQW